MRARPTCSHSPHGQSPTAAAAHAAVARSSATAADGFPRARRVRPARGEVTVALTEERRDGLLRGGKVMREREAHRHDCHARRL